ncbi:MAG: hypothetical protein LBK41_02450 [Clostridiales bacterium]|nr:hypothetical protein [Clostridiales bacterium]
MTEISAGGASRRFRLGESRRGRAGRGLTPPAGERYGRSPSPRGRRRVALSVAGQSAAIVG